MILGNVHGAIQLGRTGQRPGEGATRDTFEQLRVGEEVVFNVVRRIDARLFMVSFDGEQHVMESAMPLPLGGRVRALVTGLGSRLELEYLDPEVGAAAARDGNRTSATEYRSSSLTHALPTAPSLVSALETHYRIALHADEHTRLEHAVARAEDPSAMALGGLFLAKLGVNMNEPALQAMHEVQKAHGAASAAGWVSQTVRRDISTLVDHIAAGDEGSTQELARVIGDCLPGAPAQAMSFDSGGADTSQADSHDTQDLAKLFLNLQDDGSVGYRYGTLPVIVAGQLVELDLVVLQQRQRDEASAPVRRLVMSLKTDSFGQVRIDARALDNRLVITFTGDSPRCADELAGAGSDLRELLKRLGWNVEGIGYEVAAQPGRAARQIIDHVLSAGTIDMVL